MYYKGHRRKLTLLDKLRGWHWVGATKVRNWCGCVIQGDMNGHRH